jgi:hypothetical protein
LAVAADGDGPAIYTEIKLPAGMIVEPDGTLLFADEMNNLIRAVSSAGIISTVAGNGGTGNVTANGRATAEPVDDPSDVDLDPAGGFDITASAQLLHVDPTVLGGSSPLTGLDGIGGPALTGSLDGPAPLPGQFRWDLRLGLQHQGAALHHPSRSTRGARPVVLCAGIRRAS